MCEKERDNITSFYSQKDNVNDRFLKPKPSETCYKPEHSKIVKRSEFARDKDRIIFTRAFRRLVHKAQVYTHEKGEHYRNRLTHSLEVAQIACSISRNLGLNEDLTEAIALGHDIGHTPFGHGGEKILDEVMAGKNDLDGILNYNINFGGFKHNFQSLKTLDILERKYETIKGLNLTWQVKEGILKHTKIKRKENDTPDWDLFRFIENEEELSDLMDYPFSCTLEGQVVAVADEIAQREHDLDDGLRDKELKKIVYEDLVNVIISFIDKTRNSSICPDSQLLHYLSDLKNKLNSRKSKDPDEKKLICRRDALMRDIIEYFILDVTLNSFENILNDKKKSLIYSHNKKYVRDVLVDFSDVGDQISDKIEYYILSRVICSKTVELFDDHAECIIKELFKVYYSDPLKLTDYARFRLSQRLKKNYNDIYNLEFKNSVPINEFKPTSSMFRKIIEVIKLDNLDDLKLKDDWDLNFCDLDQIFLEINNKPINELANDKEKFIKCLLENHYAYLSSICDFISAMADNYAKRRYSEFCLGEYFLKYSNIAWWM